MKIALVGPANSVHLLRWANALAAHAEIHLISQNPARAELDPRVRYAKLPFSGGVGYYANAPFLRKAIRSIAPDIVHAHYATGYGTLCRLSGVPYYLNVWGSDVFAFPRKSAFHRRLLVGNLRSARAILSAGEGMKEEVLRYLPSARVEVIPFGVDTAVFHPAEQASPTAFRIGSMKNLERVYGTDLLILAYARARALGLPRSELIIPGEGTDRANLERLARECGYGDEIRFLGFVPHREVASLFRTYSIAAFLSREESFGVATLEASASGLPVLTSEAVGYREVVDDGRTGLRFSTQDIDGVANALVRLHGDSDERERMGNAGRKYVCERFDWDRCVQRQLEYYRSHSFDDA